PRRPSLRFTPPASSLPAAPLAPGLAGAPGRIEPFVTADFFVFAISISVRDKPLKSYGFVPVFPRPGLGGLRGGPRKKTPRANSQGCLLRVYSKNAARGVRGYDPPADGSPHPDERPRR